MSIKIIEIFVKMREVISTNKDLLLKLQEIQGKLSSHDEQLLLIFEYIKQFDEEKQQQFEQKNRRRIGFKK